MNPFVIYGLIGLAAYYIGRKEGAKDQADVDASKSLLGTPTKTLNALYGTTAIPGTNAVQNALGIGTTPITGQ